MPTTRSLTVGPARGPTSLTPESVAAICAGVNDSAVTKEPTPTCSRLARPSPMVISCTAPGSGRRPAIRRSRSTPRPNSGSVAAPIPWKSGAEGMTSPYAGRTATAATPGSRRRRATC